MEKTLKENNLKVTPGRLKILKILSQSAAPKTAGFIYKALRQKIDLVTIYRNLEKFAEKEIVFRQPVGSKDYYYLAPARHHHIICLGCEKIECVPCAHRKFLVKNFTGIRHQLLLKGLCKTCSGSQKI